MKETFIRKTAIALVISILAGTVVNGKAVDINASTMKSKLIAKGVMSEELIGEQSTVEKVTTQELITEQPTTEQPTTEQPTTEEPTTAPEYEIIDGIYKVKQGVLIEYLGDKKDKTITTLSIPASIQKIADSVFIDCKYIAKITFRSGSQLTEIGAEAFKNCTSLTDITFPKGLTKIGSAALGKCTSLKKLTIPSTVTEGYMILGKINSVTKVTFASGTKSIPSDILRYAYSVTGLSIPSGTTTIGNRAFYKCTGLKTVTIPDTITTIKSSAFNGCTALATVKMSKNLKTIGTYAFKKCTSLKQLTLKKTVTTFGSDVFSGSSELTLLVYANSKAKAYARKNKVKWQYTESEIKRRAASQEAYKKYSSMINAGDINKFALKYLKNYVPQGLCVVGDYLIVSMYYKGLQKNSILLLYNKNTGQYVKKVVLPSKDHVGSITNVKGRLVVGLTNISVTDYVAVISSSKLKKIKGGKKIKYDYITKIPGYADFATFDGTIFWAGHSANISTAKMYGYKVKVKKKKLVFTKKYSYTVPANSQGVIVKKGSGSKRTFVFSQSYGRLGDSSLITYSIKINKTSSLGKAKSTKLIPAMSEGIYMTSKGTVYIVFESAAAIYCADPDLTTEIRMKNVSKIKYSSIAQLMSK